jgi:hypothetical protein
MAVIVFDDGHIWCTKKHDNIWYDLDSLSNGPKQIEFENIFNRKGYGWIILWNNNQSFQSNTANEVANPPSKRNRMKDN